MSEPLSPRLKTALDFIAAYVKEHGYFPAYREISNHPGNAMRLVDELVARGYLKRAGGPRKWRNVVLLYNSEAVPNWEGVVWAVIGENKIMRAALHQAGLKAPPKSVDY